jgi:hypothetical protein
MYHEGDFIAKQCWVEERLSKAAHERLLHQAGHAHRNHHMKMRTVFLLRIGRLLICAGQRLESLANAGSLLSVPATLPSVPESPLIQGE